MYLTSRHIKLPRLIIIEESLGLAINFKFMFKIHFYVILKSISYLTFRIDWLNWDCLFGQLLFNSSLFMLDFLIGSLILYVYFLATLPKTIHTVRTRWSFRRKEKKERFFMRKKTFAVLHVPYHKSSVSFFFFLKKFHFSSVTKIRLYTNALESINNISVVVKMCNCTCRTCI